MRATVTSGRKRPSSSSFANQIGFFRPKKIATISVSKKPKMPNLLSTTRFVYSLEEALQQSESVKRLLEDEGVAFIVLDSHPSGLDELVKEKLCETFPTTFRASSSLEYALKYNYKTPRKGGNLVGVGSGMLTTAVYPKSEKPLFDGWNWDPMSAQIGYMFWNRILKVDPSVWAPYTEEKSFIPPDSLKLTFSRKHKLTPLHCDSRFPFKRVQAIYCNDRGGISLAAIPRSWQDDLSSRGISCKGPHIMLMYGGTYHFEGEVCSSTSSRLHTVEQVPRARLPCSTYRIYCGILAVSDEIISEEELEKLNTYRSAGFAPYPHKQYHAYLMNSRRGMSQAGTSNPPPQAVEAWKQLHK